jgi:ABC-type Fe3+/spermidine/putrescine transport system ATPase subunit
MSLEVREVSVLYGANHVLDHISLNAAGGEFIALLGASGCGKTTLLRAICGFVAVASGSIAVGERDITRLPPDKRNIAMVFQSYALWPHMTVAQNIGYGLKLRGVGRAEIARRVAELLAMLRLEGLSERKVTALSGGQRQRVALGRALAINPQILLLDEPLSNLDARIREEVRHEIKTLQQTLGITTVHVTHDRQEAMVMADRIVILDAGRAAQIGTPEEIYNRPNSPFVATFMGAGNVVPLRVRGDGKQVSDSIEVDAALLAAEGIGRWPGHTLFQCPFPQRGRAAVPARSTRGRLPRIAWRDRAVLLPWRFLPLHGARRASPIPGGRCASAGDRRADRHRLASGGIAPLSGNAGGRITTSMMNQGGHNAAGQHLHRSAGGDRHRPTGRGAACGTTAGDAQPRHRRRPKHGRLRQRLSRPDVREGSSRRHR